MSNKKNILYIMADQFRFDCINALGNDLIRTPNLDRLVRRGVAYTNAYSTCPVCVPARYTIRTGCEPAATGCYMNETPDPLDGQPPVIQDRCGEYLAKTLSDHGYRTFGIGKFHTFGNTFEDLGYDVHIHTEELWETREDRERDGYASFIANEHPEYAHIEQLHGERTNMYYQPQVSPLPAELTVEYFVSEKAIEQLSIADDRPYFGMVSFIGPHPPLAPPIPYNRLYNPDMMKNPRYGDPETDALDESIAADRYAIWAEDISHAHARTLKSRYYGEITYIDMCIGRILDAVEARDDADDTLICFFADHGDMMGDHNAWQKSYFFEASTRVPFLVSCPSLLEKNSRSDELVCLTDLFALAASAAGHPETRDGIDFLNGEQREYLAGIYKRPGTIGFKIMIRQGAWKYIYLANGGREQLFNLQNDPDEASDLSEGYSEICSYLRELAVRHCERPGLQAALEDGRLRQFPFQRQRPLRINQFSFDKDLHDFTIPFDNNGISMP